MMMRSFLITLFSLCVLSVNGTVRRYQPSNLLQARFADVEPSEKEYPTGAAVAEGSNGPQTPLDMKGPKDFEFEPTEPESEEEGLATGAATGLDEEEEEEEATNWRSSKGEGEDSSDASYDEDTEGEGMSIEDAIKAGEKAADELDEQDEDLSEIAEDVIKLGGVVLQGSIRVEPMSTDIWTASPMNSNAMEKTIGKILVDAYVGIVGHGGDNKAGTLRMGHPVCTDTAVDELEEPFGGEDEDESEDEDETEVEELDEDENAAEDLAEDLGADEEDMESQTDALRYEVTFSFQKQEDDKNLFCDDLSVVFSQRVQCDLKDVDAEYEFVSSPGMEGHQEAKMFVWIRGDFRGNPREIAASEAAVLVDLHDMGSPVVIDLEITLIGMPDEEEIEEEKEAEEELEDALSATGGAVSSTGGEGTLEELAEEDDDAASDLASSDTEHYESEAGDNTYKPAVFLEESVSRCSVPFEVTWTPPVPTGIGEHARDVLLALNSADLSSRYLKAVEDLDSASKLLLLRDRMEMSVSATLTGVKEDEEGKKQEPDVTPVKKKDELDFMKGYDELIVKLFVRGLSAGDVVYRKWKFGSMIERILADASINANVQITDVYSQVLTSNGDCVKDPKKDSLAVKAEGDEFLQITENQLRFRETPQRCPCAVVATVLLRDVKVKRATQVLYNTPEETWKSQAEKYEVISEEEKEELSDDDNAFGVDTITHVDRAKARQEIREREEAEAAAAAEAEDDSLSSSSSDESGVSSSRVVSLGLLFCVLVVTGVLM